MEHWAILGHWDIKAMGHWDQLNVVHIGKFVLVLNEVMCVSVSFNEFDISFVPSLNADFKKYKMV